MGETSVYYVPRDQRTWVGRRDELADRLWNVGVITDADFILERVKRYEVTGRTLPECNLNLFYGGLGIVDEDAHPVPNHQYDVSCPSCGRDVVEQFYEVMSTEADQACAEREVRCSACQASSRMDALRYGDPVAFAGFYVYVSDCDPNDWDTRFRPTLEGIVGQCDEFWEWST